MIKYRTMWNEIKEVEIKKETPKQVVLLDESREAKISDWRSYFDTWREAKAHLVEMAQEKIIKAESHLKYEMQILVGIEALNKDDATGGK